MDRLIVRRIKMDNHAGRGDINYLIFEQGNITQPLVCLTDNQMEDLVRQYDEQVQEAADAEE